MAQIQAYPYHVFSGIYCVDGQSPDIGFVAAERNSKIKAGVPASFCRTFRLDKHRENLVGEEHPAAGKFESFIAEFNQSVIYGGGQVPARELWRGRSRTAPGTGSKLRPAVIRRPRNTNSDAAFVGSRPTTADRSSINSTYRCRIALIPIPLETVIRMGRDAEAATRVRAASI
jgi:hypothetical protein